ncbi:MAG: hypothetical protein ACI837_001405 [Crocinitomicaceae bacterium]|jgi:hypothetical protein
MILNNNWKLHSEMEKSEYLKNFGSYPVPKILNDLFDFDTAVAFDNWFSNGFELINDSEKMMLRSYSDDESFLRSLVCFANADGTGSTYALWIHHESDDLEKAPIVVFGSEGGFHIVAKNLIEFLQLLTFDGEPMVSWENVTYFKGEDEEESKYHLEYKNWLRDSYEINPISDASSLVANAQKTYQQEFNLWMKKYYSD